MTVKGGTTPACAACKYQRRKCTPTCPLAPYFPANQPKMFQNVHRLFGVSNITKTLNSLKSKDQKEDAMKSIIYEAEMRERFPVYGCSIIIFQLRHLLQCTFDDLNSVQGQLMALREQQSQMESGSDAASVLLQRQSFCNDVPLSSSSSSHNYCNNSNSQTPFAPFVGDGFYGGSGDMLDYMGRPLFGGLEPSSSLDSNLTAIQSQMDALSILQDRDMFANDFDGGAYMRIEDRQSYIDTKEAFESSSNSSLKNNMKESGDGELKTAAAGFTLTPLN